MSSLIWIIIGKLRQNPKKKHLKTSKKSLKFLKIAEMSKNYWFQRLIHAVGILDKKKTK